MTSNHVCLLFRPPGIYKGDYILELFQLYGDIEDAPEAPALPNWHSESDDGPSYEAAADGDSKLASVF